MSEVKLFDIANSLNDKTEIEYDISKYDPFMINRFMSNTMSTIFFAEAMNRYYHLSKTQQRDFYLYGIPKGKRFGKWNKKISINTDTQMIMNYYHCNLKVAESYLKLMNESALQNLREKTNNGGGK